MVQRSALLQLACLVAVLHSSCLSALLSSTIAAAAPAAARDTAISSRHNTPITAASPSPLFTVFGYLPEYRRGTFNYEAFFKAGLTHLIFFSAEVDPATLRLIHVEDRLPSGDEWARIRRLADLHGVKLMLCIGGGGRSAGFADLVGDTVQRQAFIEEVNAVLLARKLDGIDFNWEYPQTMTEWLNFGRFLMELRSSLGYAAAAGGEHAAGPIGERRHRTRVRGAALSMALHPHPSMAAVLQSARVLHSLDYVHLMAYDHVVGTGPHSSVEYAASVLSEETIGLFNEAAYNRRLGQMHRRPRTEQDHRRKLTLGIPFYGRHREDRRLQPEAYDRLWLFIQEWASKNHPTWVEGGAELRALSEYDGYSFTGYDDVKRKMQLTRAANLSGIMIWELGQDVPPGTSPMSLMTAVHEQLADWGLLTDGGRGSGGNVNSDNAYDRPQPPPQHSSPDVAEDGDL
ncbi:chitinase / CHI-1 [Leishmania donovani]|uniref:Chitinase n=2 Tax=Leishmania donovani TaxID=5661 RepID=O60994_LEIDO|nr:chitinase [Leishmania donovani]AAC17944.1 chitinase [Leishmania donovani]AYU77661.1 chitinase [Leishmania donovani]TPP40973.1 Glycosyl hydrolases 18 family protein [Leishmania donovani]TPP51162.1 Glycosyl hydrolases 18 family protein [Leishmania donovani]CAJ1987670.1 chitinase / CHI-1 [Leishmania donovani]